MMGAALMTLPFATPASARNFMMGGNWIVRNGQVFIPLQFAFGGPAMTNPTMDGAKGIHASMGNLSGALGFPNGPMPVAGAVTAKGSAPASLMIPLHRAVEDVMALIPLSGVYVVQISTNFGIDNPFAAATLAKNGGPGNFTWCPADAACVRVPGPHLKATDPPQGAGGPLRNGRIIYVKGANRFGGTLQVGLKRGGDNVGRFGAGVPYRAGHARFGVQPEARNLAPGAGSADNPKTEMVFLEVGPITQPLVAPLPQNLILFPGPNVTTKLGTSIKGTGMLKKLPQIATGPAPTFVKAGSVTSNYGFAHTTGTVLGQQTMGTAAEDFFTFMGSDMRTALGAGNITTVAGGISFRNNTQAANNPYVSMHRFKVSLGAPIPSMSPAGFAAAGALMLLAVGYALRRRLS
jgi:hypothetical protein